MFIMFIVHSYHAIPVDFKTPVMPEMAEQNTIMFNCYYRQKQKLAQ